MQTIRTRVKDNRVRRSGFTLMEVLLVLAILVVIMGLVLPNLIGASKKGYIRAARVTIGGVESACEMYAMDHDGEFPNSLDALISNPGSSNKWKGPYLKDSSSAPSDPWGMPLQYSYPGQRHATPDRPDIWSSGPDKQSNTDDDINNWTKA
ncbi:MAG: prepilin-type N-terminal cleavage/methylation domain-containing protein [Planctomycetaceae bacterium]|nr:prepilin-type N-terminal cleavage/methylation domain-containing protein [Planctomycetaceae bacterium]